MTTHQTLCISNMHWKDRTQDYIKSILFNKHLTKVRKRTWLTVCLLGSSEHIPQHREQQQQAPRDLDLSPVVVPTSWRTHTHIKIHTQSTYKDGSWQFWNSATDLGPWSWVLTWVSKVLTTTTTTTTTKSTKKESNDLICWKCFSVFSGFVISFLSVSQEKVWCQA